MALRQEGDGTHARVYKHHPPDGGRTLTVALTLTPDP